MKTVECVVCDSCGRTIPKAEGLYFVVKGGTRIMCHNNNNTENTLLDAASDCAVCDIECLKDLLNE